MSISEYDASAYVDARKAEEHRLTQEIRAFETRISPETKATGRLPILLAAVESLTRATKPATAAKLTTRLKAEDCPAVHYADRKEVTGALTTVKSRTKTLANGELVAARMHADRIRVIDTGIRARLESQYQTLATRLASVRATEIPMGARARKVRECTIYAIGKDLSDLRSQIEGLAK